MSILREQIQLLGTFLRSDFRKTLIRCAIAMLVIMLLGGAAGLAFPEVVEETLSMFMEVVEDAGVIDEDGNFSVFALLANNWSAMLMSAAYGLIPFVYLPAVSLFSNSFLIGVMAAWYHASGISLLVFAAGILPHGIFELPALVISIACGIYLCRNMSRTVTGRQDRRPFAALLCDLLRVLLLLVAPMTVAAALIECYITPLVISLFL